MVDQHTASIFPFLYFLAEIGPVAIRLEYRPFEIYVYL